MNQMQWGVIMMKNLGSILFYDIGVIANRMFTNISSSVPSVSCHKAYLKQLACLKIINQDVKIIAPYQKFDYIDFLFKHS